jgi:hypothetical protein
MKRREVYIKAILHRSRLGFVMLWPDAEELTQAGLWQEGQDDVDTIEYKLCCRAKQIALYEDREEPEELIIYCSNPAAYVCLDQSIRITFRAHEPNNTRSLEAVAAALHYAKP